MNNFFLLFSTEKKLKYQYDFLKYKKKPNSKIAIGGTLDFAPMKLILDIYCTLKFQKLKIIPFRLKKRFFCVAVQFSILKS